MGEIDHRRCRSGGHRAEPTMRGRARWRRLRERGDTRSVIVVLAGGVGAARFLRGVVRVVPPGEVTVVGNTGDDIEIYGVHVSPDLDIVIYTIGGAIDEEQGWGLAGDTHVMLEELRALGNDAWFSLGDRDF